jgi:hypothetical protein
MNVDRTTGIAKSVQRLIKRLSNGETPPMSDIVMGVQDAQALVYILENFSVTGAGAISKERDRHTKIEGWTPSHDDQHTEQSMPIAAACYALNGTPAQAVIVNDDNDPEKNELWDAWPWSPKWDKREKHSRLHQLEIAGALIAAEWDRLKRIENENLSTACVTNSD